MDMLLITLCISQILLQLILKEVLLVLKELQLVPKKTLLFPKELQLIPKEFIPIYFPAKELTRARILEFLNSLNLRIMRRE